MCIGSAPSVGRVNGSLAALAAGLGTGLGLIVAIGAQNAFVLRQGILRAHVSVVVVICTLSDALLICLGVAGVGSVLRLWPVAVTAVTWLGAAFLLAYATLAARRALNPSAMAPLDGTSARTRRNAVLTCLALTWLNPHVYLDTVLMLGSVANGFESRRWWFATGAVAGSLLWFVALGYGARLLGGLFARPVAWRILDGLIALIMLTLGVVMLSVFFN